MTSSTKVIGVGGTSGALKALSVDDFFDYLSQRESAANTPRALFGRVAWLFRAVQLRSSALGGMPYAVYSGEEEYDWDDRYPRLHRVLSVVEADLCLSGAAYVLKKRIFPGTRREEMADLQRLNPWTVEVLTKPHPEHGLTQDVDGVYGFRQQLSDEPARWFARDQMIYFDHLYNPFDDLGPGVAPASVCGLPAELVAHMNEYASAFFERGAVTPFVLRTESTVPVDEQERLSNLFKRLYQGVANFFKVPLLQKGLDIAKLGSAPKDLAMPDLEDSAKKQVAAALGIPPGLLEQQDASHATAKTHQLSFYTETIIPEAEMMEERINDDLMDRLGLELRFKPEELEVIQQQEAEKASSVALILNEMRQSASTGLLEKWEARFYLDVLMRQMEMPALEDIEKPPDWEEPERPPQLAPPQFQARQDSGEIEDDEEASKKGFPPAGGPGPPEELWSELGKWRAKAEKRGAIVDFESDVIPGWLAVQVMAAQKLVGPDDAFLFLKQAETRGVIERRMKRNILAVLRAFEDDALGAVTEGDPFPYDRLESKLRSVIRPAMQTITTSQALAIASEIGIAFDPTFINHTAAEWARQYSFEWVTGIVQQTRETLQDAISAYIETPEIDLAELSKMLEPAFGEYRARMISVTEVTRAYEQANQMCQERLEEEGLVTVRVWHTAGDDIVCPICGPLDGEPHPDWPAEHDDGPPAHPNCRCVTGLSSRPLAELRREYRDLQAARAEQIADWGGAETGGNV